jgi:hypothetical protein
MCEENHARLSSFEHSSFLRHSSFCASPPVSPRKTRGVSPCLRGFVISRFASRRSLPLDPSPLPLQFTATAFRLQNSFLKCRWPRRFAPPLFFMGCNLSSPLPTLSILNRIQQSFPRQFPILYLRPRILHSHADSAGPVSQSYRCSDFVYVLSTRPARPRESFLQIDLANAKPRHSRA